MNYLTSSQIAELWGISDRSVRNYCAEGRIEGAKLIGKIWHIPEGSEKPVRKNVKENSLASRLKKEKSAKLKGGIYHKVQIELTYNSNHIEGSRLTHEQTRYIYETNTIGITDESVNVDDIVETLNHFRCVDKIIDCISKPVSESLIKELHFMLKSGTDDSRKEWFNVGEYKRFPNEVCGRETTAPEKVAEEICKLLERYNGNTEKTFEDLLDFHVKFERIHPFQDGNGRVGRLLLFKECLKYNTVPFIIGDDLKMFYYRGLKEWDREKGYLTDTCLTAQDRFKKYLDYFKIEY